MIVTTSVILIVFIALYLSMIPVAAFLIALYFVVKAAVKKGILEADEEKRKRKAKNKLLEE